jgi:hypothetical protein
MKKKHHHKKGRRNNGSGGVASGSHPRPRPRLLRLPRRGRPDWKSVAVALASGASSAALGALVVNQKILSPEAVGFGLMLGGGTTALYADGLTRAVGTGVASAGAGQFLLTLLTKQAIKGTANQNAAQAARPQTTNQSEQPAAPPPVPPPPVEPSRRSATDGGVVVDLFRDTASDLDMIDDEFRFGMRDDPRDAAEPLVIDLDEAA